MDIQTLYQESIRFAGAKHQEKAQKVPGTDLPYVVHLSNVTMEIIIASFHSHPFNVEFAVQVALLHDTLEDTSTRFEDLETEFGADIAHAVAALTKNETLPKDQQMHDSLVRIKLQPHEVWAVKLADRITNLQPPPQHWDQDKIIQYQIESRIIYKELKDGNSFLATRLEQKISDYSRHVQR